MISGWTASSRDSSKTEEGKAPRGYGQIRSELRMSSKLKLSRILPCRAKIRPARFVSLCLRAIISGERPSGYHSPSPPEDVGSISFSRKVFAGTKDSAKCIGPVHWPAAAECLTR